MKNILAVLGLLVVSQMLVAVLPDMGLELIEPNEYSLRIPELKRIRPELSEKPESIKIEEDNDQLWEVFKEKKGLNPTICFTGDCGIGNYKINSQIIKVK